MAEQRLKNEYEEDNLRFQKDGAYASEYQAMGLSDADFQQLKELIQEDPSRRILLPKK